MASGLQKGSMKNGIQGKNADQQRSEFSEFQKHGQLSGLEQNPHTHTRSDIGEVGFFLRKNPV
jgi:hypothetical protein